MEKPLQMTTLKTTWTSANGSHEVVTTRAESESDTEHAARHRAAVFTAQFEFPKVD